MPGAGIPWGNSTAAGGAMPDAYAMHTARFHRTTAQQGASLIGVLVALLILAVGGQGAMLLQAQALRVSAAAADLTHASFIAYDLLDRMRANPDALAEYAMQLDQGCHPATPGASVVQTDRNDFMHAVTCELPAAHPRAQARRPQVRTRLGWAQGRRAGAGAPAGLLLPRRIGGGPRRGEPGPPTPESAWST